MKKILLIMLMLLSAYAFGKNPESTKESGVKKMELSTHYFQTSKVDSLAFTRPIYNEETEKKEMKTSLFVLSTPTSAYPELGIVVVVSFLVMYFWFLVVKKSDKLALRLVSWLLLIFGLILAYFLWIAEFENLVLELWVTSIFAPAVISVLLFISADDIFVVVRNIFIGLMIILSGIFFIYLLPGAIMFFYFSSAGLLAGLIVSLIIKKTRAKKLSNHAHLHAPG